MALLVFRILVSLIFLLTSLPKVLLWGRAPGRSVKDNIVWKRASWFDLEVTAAYHTWQVAFGYPTLLLRPCGLMVLSAVAVLNIFPPPSALGYKACFFLVMLLGGGMWTWIFNYKSPRHCVPLFVTLLALTIVTSVKDDVKGHEMLDSSSWIRTLLVRTVLPLSLGVAGGPVLKYLGRLEEEHRD